MSSMYPPAGGQAVQSCARCGLPLLPDVPVCRNCGWYNAVPPQPFVNNNQAMPIQNPQANYNTGFVNPQPGSYYVPSAMNGNGYRPAAPNTYQSAPPMANGNGYRPTTPNTYQPTPPMMNGFSPGNYFQPPQHKRGNKVGLILLISILLLIIIGGGSAAGYFFLVKNHNQNTPTPTPTFAITTPSVKPFFSDNFANNATRWDLTSSPGKYSASVGGGQMLLEDDHNQLLWEILPGKQFADFRLDVDAKLTKGDSNNGYGVFIRGTASQGSDISLYYRFELYGDGSYAVFKGTLDANGNPQSAQITANSNAAIRPEGSSNHITIIAKGSTMTLMVNGAKVYTYTDSTYKGGEVALFVSNVKSAKAGAQALFAHLAIFPVS